MRMNDGGGGAVNRSCVIHIVHLPVYLTDYAVQRRRTPFRAILSAARGEAQCAD
jgi:hypothetical protein